MQSDIDALIEFAVANGRTWKAELRRQWANASAGPELQRLRNSSDFGPAGLAKFRLPVCERHGKPIDPQSHAGLHRPGFCSICNSGHKAV